MSNIYKPFQGHFRPQRLKLFYSSFRITHRTRVLDLGGGLYFWELARSKGFPVPSVTVLNVRPPNGPLPSGMKWIVGDARRTGLDEQSFDVVFSNSLIEHLENWDSQRGFASEVERLSTKYFIQTPNKWFFVEPHFVTPCVHWLPKSLRVVLGPKATLWGWTRGASRPKYEEQLRQIQLLSVREMRRLFPDARIVMERCMGMVKSIVAIRGEGTS